MSKSLELALCDTQGQLFELSGERGINSEAFIKAFMTTDISKDMDSEFNHVQWAGKEYIYSRMEDECKDAIATGEVYDKETLYWTGYIYHNPDTVDIIPGIVEDVRNKGHWGTGDLRVIIKSTEDFEKAQHLINRAYNEN